MRSVVRRDCDCDCACDTGVRREGLGWRCTAQYDRLVQLSSDQVSSPQHCICICIPSRIPQSASQSQHRCQKYKSPLPPLSVLVLCDATNNQHHTPPPAQTRHVSSLPSFVSFSSLPSLPTNPSLHITKNPLPQTNQSPPPHTFESGHFTSPPTLHPHPQSPRPASPGQSPGPHLPHPHLLSV